MARPASGQVVERTGKSDKAFALRFRAYGRREYLTLGTQGEGWTKAKAHEELANVLADVRRGIWQPAAPKEDAPRARQTFHEFADDWFRDREPDWKPSTVVDYRWALELHLLPAFGTLPLDGITAEGVDRYARAKQREGKLSNNSINKTLNTLSMVLDTAVDYERIARNPAKGKKRRLRGEARSRPVVAPEQLLTLLGTCDRTLRPIVATLGGAGLRIGEAVALTWADVNLANGTIKVVDAKTAAGIRTVDMPMGLAGELRLWKARTSADKPTDRVFRKNDGGAQTSKNAWKRLKNAIKRANVTLRRMGIEPIAESATPHSLRRTYASLRFGVGDDPVYVMEQMGHTEAIFTMKVYASALKRRQRLLGSALEQFEAAVDWARLGTSGPVPNLTEPRFGSLERSQP